MRQNHPNGLSWNNLKAILLRNSLSEIFGNAKVSLRQQEQQECYFKPFIINHQHKPVFNQYTLLIQEFYNRKSLNIKNVGKTSVTFYFISHHKRTHSKEKLSECKKCWKASIDCLQLNI